MSHAKFSDSDQDKKYEPMKRCLILYRRKRWAKLYHKIPIPMRR
jgi:hypothetical protein